VNKVLFVKLVDTDEYPRHGLQCTGEGWPNWKAWRGREITVYEDIVKPNASWRCGTRFVLRVTPETVLRIIPNSRFFDYYVCEHQIQGEDCQELREKLSSSQGGIVKYA
jgi:hypothetical protein